jgi:predicted AAA+ superfamily ATPase
VDAIGATEVKTIIFDEIHKYPHWKNFLKGFFDTHEKQGLNIVVTGSARLDVYRKGADSLMGRYFPYRMHPLTVAEVVSPRLKLQEIKAPKKIKADDFAALKQFGGFPEPFIRRSRQFHNRWKRMRTQLLFREELRDTSRIYEVGQVELLAKFLERNAAQLMNYASLARKVRCSEDSARRWTSVLESLYFCYLIRPWSRNVPRSLLKDPKVYLWDWSVLDPPGIRNENMVASHLLKAVHSWQDIGLGEYNLFFLRTKDKKEVDFLVTRDEKPWFLVEVKSSWDDPLSKSLSYFQEITEAKHAFQVVVDADYSNVDCFETTRPVKVAAINFLSQLV